MKCPRCGSALAKVTEKSTKLDRCAKCGGTWYDDHELGMLKDKESHGDYRWIDVELWRDKDKFLAKKQERLACPKDGQTMLTVHYGEFPIRVDICPACKGKWLDRDEYQKIVKYLEEKVDSESVGDYLHDVAEEFVDIFTHPTNIGHDLGDIGKILYLLQLRFGVQHETSQPHCVPHREAFPAPSAVPTHMQAERLPSSSPPSPSPVV